MAVELAGRVALVVGAASPLGVAASNALAAAGARVAINDWSDSAAERLAAELDAEGHACLACPADASKKLALQTAIEPVLAAWERIDILVNASAIQPGVALLDLDEWDWRRTLDLNLSAAVIATQVLGRIFRELGGGLIVNLVEPAAMEASPSYAVAAGGLRALTETTLRALAPHNIAVHLIECDVDVLAPQLLQVLASQATS